MLQYFIHLISAKQKIPSLRPLRLRSENVILDKHEFKQN
jgi:hypothetical protein